MKQYAVVRDCSRSLLNCRMPLFVALVLVFGLGQEQAQTVAANSTALRDAASLTLLNGALQKLGGAAAWQSVRASHVTGTISASNGKSRTVDWLDDWSQGSIRYRRTSSDGSKSRTAWHDGSPVFNTKQGSRTMAVREFDKSAILLAHLPGAALEEILSNTNYKMTASTVAGTAGSTEIDVIVTEAGRPKPETEERWFISTESGLPNSVLLRIPDILNSTHVIWQAVTFTHYKQEHGLVVPDQVEIIPPNRQLFIYKLTSFEANPQVSASDFKAEASQ